MGPLPRKKSIRKKKVQFEKDDGLPKSRSSDFYLKHSAVKNMRDEIKAQQFAMTLREQEIKNLRA